MTNIGNRIAFDNKNYDVDKTNKGENKTSVRQNFADKLNEFSSDNKITADEKSQLEALSNQGGTAAEKAIVVTLSKAGKAAFDPDLSDSMDAVEISFGDPKSPVGNTEAPNSTVPVETPKTPVAGEIGVTIGATNSKYPTDLKISKEMAGFLEGSVASGKGISYEEFQQAVKIAASTGTPGDKAILDSLAGIAINQKDDKKATATIKIGNDKQLQFRVDTTPPPEGRADRVTGGKILDIVAPKVVDIGIKLLDKWINKSGGEKQQTGVGTGNPTSEPGAGEKGKPIPGSGGGGLGIPDMKK